MSLIKLFEDESEIFKSNSDEYGPLIRNVEGLINVMCYAIEPNQDAMKGFYILNNQVMSMLYQALMSALKKHEVISRYCIRNAIETGVLATYSIKETDLNEYFTKRDIGIDPKRKTLDKAYKYVEEILDTHQSRLYDLKKQANNAYLHGNMFTAFKLDRPDHYSAIAHFDNKHNRLTKSLIWQIGHVAGIIFDMYIVSAKLNTVNYSIEKKDEYIELVRENQYFREEYMRENNIQL